MSGSAADRPPGVIVGHCIAEKIKRQSDRPGAGQIAGDDRPAHPRQRDRRQQPEH